MSTTFVEGIESDVELKPSSNPIDHQYQPSTTERAVIHSNMFLAIAKRHLASPRPKFVTSTCFFVAAFVFLLGYNRKDQNPGSTGLLALRGGLSPVPVQLSELSRKEEGERRRYNLIDPQDLARINLNMMDCTTERMNELKMAQDHPCVVDIIRRQYLHPPAPANVAYNLSGNGTNEINFDPSAGQSQIILDLLKNKTQGFFFECGANDGLMLSNTLRMERALGWTGLLIEADPYTYYENLLPRKRKAWTVPACLSLEPYPTRVPFRAGKGPDSGLNLIMSDTSADHIEKLRKTNLPILANDTMNMVQCFPLYSILLAADRTQLDFLSLDLEGHELKVLQTVPWSKVDVATMAVESAHILEGEDKLLEFMEEIGFTNTTKFVNPWAWDMIFAKKTMTF